MDMIMIHDVAALCISEIYTIHVLKKNKNVNAQVHFYTGQSIQLYCWRFTLLTC